MSFVILPPKMVAAEHYYGGSVIARTPFTVEVRALTSNGMINTNYNGTVNLYANSPNDDKAYQIGYAILRNGIGTSTNLTISSVYGTGSGRKITAYDGVDTGSVSVGVWFQGKATEFSISGSSACGSNPPKYYVALPKSGLCGTQVVVYNPNTDISLGATVYDVGPWVPVPNSTCGDDPYWNTGTIPFSVQHEGELRCQVCNIDCAKDNYLRFNGAIIDLGTQLMRDLGGSGTITNAIWRFM